MKNVQEYLDLLGFEVQDAVTRFKGVVTSIAFDLPGCVQASVNQAISKEGKLGETYWFDVNRLTKISKKPVMKRPEFLFEIADVPGPVLKPVRR